jgi:hypothetical protein
MTKQLSVAAWLIIAGLAADVSAQRVELWVDKVPVGEFGSTVMPTNLDGNTTTHEWVVARPSQTAGGWEWKSLALVDGQLCSGAWFNPFLLVPIQEFTCGVLSNVDGRAVYVVQGVRWYGEIAFVMPTCGNLSSEALGTERVPEVQAIDADSASGTMASPGRVQRLDPSIDLRPVLDPCRLTPAVIGGAWP